MLTKEQIEIRQKTNKYFNDQYPVLIQKLVDGSISDHELLILNYMGIATLVSILAPPKPIGSNPDDYIG